MPLSSRPTSTAAFSPLRARAMSAAGSFHGRVKPARCHSAVTALTSASTIGAMVRAGTGADAAVVKLIPGARPVPFGHLGDGNIHYNVSEPVGADTADFMARWHDVNAVVFEVVLRMGGSISAEHGIGVLKRDELPDVKDKVAIELMRGIKAMLDPLGIMNPGKVL